MVELKNLEIYELCMLDEESGEMSFYKEKKIKGYTGLYFKDENAFFGFYPSGGGIAIYYKGKKYPLTSELTISLTKQGKSRTFRIDDYNIEINYTESPYIGFDVWSDEIDVDLFYLISQRYKEQAFYDQYSAKTEML